MNCPKYRTQGISTEVIAFGFGGTAIEGLQCFSLVDTCLRDLGLSVLARSNLTEPVV